MSFFSVFQPSLGNSSPGTQSWCILYVDCGCVWHWFEKYCPNIYDLKWVLNLFTCVKKGKEQYLVLGKKLIIERERSHCLFLYVSTNEINKLFIFLSE